MKQKKSVEILPYSDNITFSNLGRRPRIDKSKYSAWLNKIANRYNYCIVSLNYTFCTDDELLNINMEHLNHDYYTDIITFDLSEQKKNIEGDIYISIDRVRENARLNKVEYYTELKRVIAHGLLHLLGFKDKQINEVKKMRQAEDNALSIF